MFTAPRDLSHNRIASVTEGSLSLLLRLESMFVFKSFKMKHQAF
jgi:hypothetical protein